MLLIRELHIKCLHCCHNAVLPHYSHVVDTFRYMVYSVNIRKYVCVWFIYSEHLCCGFIYFLQAADTVLPTCILLNCDRNQFFQIGTFIDTAERDCNAL